MWWRRKMRERNLQQEIEAHLQAEAEDRSGDTAAARRAFGNIALVQEETRAAWGWGSLERLAQDVRYALRLLRKSSAFTITAALSLAIGIGMNTAMFTLVDAVLLRKLPVRSPDELVLLAERSGSRQNFSLPTPAVQALSDSGALSCVGAFFTWRFQTAVHGEPQLVNGQLVSDNYFSLLGVNAFLGRTLTAEDDRAPVAVLGYDYWRRAFGKDSGVIGQTVEIQRHPFTIVGVTAPGFLGLDPGNEIDITVPLTMQPVVIPGAPLLDSRETRWLHVFGRRKPGVTLVQAQANLAVLWGRLHTKTRLEVLPGSQGRYDLRRQFALPLRLLMCAVAVVLLVACANLASLLLARATARRQEIALRLSIGATRGRLLRQLLTESILLAIFGGALGLALAESGVPLLIRLMSRGRVPLALDLSLDVRVLIFTAAVSIATGILFGIAPALRATSEVSLHGARLTSRISWRWTGALIVAQVCLCLMVLVSAGLLLGSLRNLRQEDAGFRKDHLLLVSIRPGMSGYDDARANRVYADLYDRLSALPGVQSVTFSGDVPLGGVSYTANASTPGAVGSAGVAASVNIVGPRFFETMGTSLISGRELGAQDGGRAVISESVARALFGGRNALGEHIAIGEWTMQVVGVSRDTHYQSLREPPQPMIYRPYQPQMSGEVGELTFAIHTIGAPDNMINTVRSVVREAAPGVPVFALGTMEERVDASLVQERMVSALSAWFGAFALLLAAIGLYGRLAYAVVERTREIGVRMALGAARPDVVWAIVRQVLALVVIGAALGIPLSLACARAIRSLLFAVPPFDPLTLLAVVVVVFTAAALAACVPACRAARVDPMVVLRYE
jgi:predicted permease